MPSKERDTEVRLIRSKIFRSKIRMYFSVQFYVVCNYNFKTISIKEMEPNFVRMKVPRLKKDFQSVLPISAAKTELLNLSLKAH